MSQFTLFKKIVPATMLMMAPPTFAGLPKTTCKNLDSKFAIAFNEVTFRVDSKFAFFDYVKLNGTEFYGGQGSMMGQGLITENTLNLELTWTATGSREKNAVGKLVGKKVNGRWSLKLAPFNYSQNTYSSNYIPLAFCSQSIR